MKTTGVLNLQPYELIELSNLVKIMNYIPIVDTEREEIFRVGESNIGFNEDKTVTIEHNYGFMGMDKVVVNNPSYFSVLIIGFFSAKIHVFRWELYEHLLFV